MFLRPRTNHFWWCTAALAWLLFDPAAYSVSDQSKNLAALQQRIDELDHAGKYREAVPVAEERLRLVEKLVSSDITSIANSCNKLGELYRKNGNYAKAKPICERGLEIREKVLGLDDPHTAESLNELALIYLVTGDSKTAEPLCERALKIREKTFGPEHRDTASSLNTLALLYREMGDNTKAEPLCQRALQIREKTLGPEHPDTASSLNNRAELYRESADYAKSEALHQRALKIREKALGPEHPATAESLDNLAGLYYLTGEYVKAEPLYRRALGIRERILGPDHPATGESFDNLGCLHYLTGDYAKAEPLFQRALRIRDKSLGPEHPVTAASLNNLALLYDDMGDYAKAELLYERALNIREKTLGPDHPETAIGINNLAVLYFEMGDYAKSYPLYQRALQIWEKSLGPEHPRTATSLDNLAVLQNKMGDYTKSESFYQRALQIREKTLGPDHPETATSLNNLALLYDRMGEYAKAESLYQRALKSSEKVLGPDHPDTALTLNNLALLYCDMGDTKEALRLAGQARRAEEKILSNILSFTSEQQRLAFQKTSNPYILFASLGNAPEIAQIVLREKGVVLDSLLEDRLVAEASADPKQRKIIEELRSAKERLTKLITEVPNDLSESARQQRDAEKDKIAAEVEQLEGDLARKVTGLGRARRALSVTVAQIQSILPPQAALIELLRYSHYLGNGKSEPRYGALVIRAKGEPGWIPLGGAAEIEKSVVLYQKSVRGKTDQLTLSAVLRKLEEQLWVPIDKALPAGTTTVIVSPDAELSFVSFAALLMPDDRFVGEKYSVRYVASGRDLLRDAKSTAGSKTTMRIFANPDFAGISANPPSEQTKTVALRSVEMSDLQSISLPNLPGTVKESAALEGRAKRSGWYAQMYLGAKATEAELRKVSSPRILHLATHGFFLSEIDIAKGKGGGDSTLPKGKLLNPMHRSGLALAGAQRTLRAWTNGEVPPMENDGVVTAEEVGGLKLEGTWLVALSACDTGGGEARMGEGVMGLRRGFVQAGGQNLLMTLWPISDDTRSCSISTTPRSKAATPLKLSPTRSAIGL